MVFGWVCIEGNDTKVCGAKCYQKIFFLSLYMEMKAGIMSHED